MSIKNIKIHFTFIHFCRSLFGDENNQRLLIRPIFGNKRHVCVEIVSQTARRDLSRNSVGSIFISTLSRFLLLRLGRRETRGEEQFEVKWGHVLALGVYPSCQQTSRSHLNLVRRCGFYIPGSQLQKTFTRNLLPGPFLAHWLSPSRSVRRMKLRSFSKSKHTHTKPLVVYV